MDSNKNTPKEKSTVKKAAVKKAAPKKVAAKKTATKKATTNKVVAKKPVVKKTVSKKVEAKKAAPKEATKKQGFFSRLLGSVTENVVEGATFVGEKVAETSAKAYVAGTELVHETSEKIHDFTEKQSLHKEESKIQERQTTLKYAFGELTLAKYLETESLPKSYLTTKQIAEIVSEFKSNSKRIIEIQKELENH